MRLPISRGYCSTVLSSALLSLTDVELEAMATSVEHVAIEDTAFFCDRMSLQVSQWMV